MAVPTKNLEIKTNGWWNRTWQVTNNGVPVDLTGISFLLEVRRGKGPNAPRVLQLTTGGGLSVPTPSNGKINVSVPPQPTILSRITGKYDLIPIIGGLPQQPWLQGDMVLDPGVSHVGP